MKNTIYGYCRISRPTQNIERQERNIKAKYPDAHITKEAYTGTRIQGRKELEKIVKIVTAGDCIVFDSVSRMSRNADEGVELYERLYNEGVELVFLKEPHINTAVYREALQRQLATIQTGDKATDKLMNSIIDALNDYQMDLAKQQIRIAFEQAEKEVTDLHERTSEGMKTAKLNGKRIGTEKGSTWETKKAKAMKTEIVKYSKRFNGNLNDKEVIKITGLSRNTYYKYIKELQA